jgi:OOP family OmpA-OmpF porin
VEIVGHTDIKGKWKYNVVLSEKRALEVKDYLVKHAISEDRLLYYGRGSLAPKTSNDTDENRSKNRRVEITIIE